MKEGSVGHLHHRSLSALPLPVMDCFHFLWWIPVTSSPCRMAAAIATPLRPSQFQHTLHIFTKERGFNCKIRRLVFGDQSADRIKDELQFWRVFHFTRFPVQPSSSRVTLLPVMVISPYPITIVPGSIPGTILSGFCRGAMYFTGLQD